MLALAAFLWVRIADPATTWEGDMWDDDEGRRDMGRAFGDDAHGGAKANGCACDSLPIFVLGCRAAGCVRAETVASGQPGRLTERGPVPSGSLNHVGWVAVEQMVGAERGGSSRTRSVFVIRSGCRPSAPPEGPPSLGTEGAFRRPTGLVTVEVTLAPRGARVWMCCTGLAEPMEGT